MARPLAWLALPLVAALHAAAVPPAAAAPDERDARIGRIDAFVAAEMAGSRIPGLALAVVDAGRVVLARGYGLANLEHGVPVGRQTVFQTGSVGKQFTAAAVMSLVEEGRIGLDDPLARWFPAAPPAWQAITVRHLLTHTSGIPGYDGTPGSPTGIDYRRDYTEDELARFAMALTPAFAPGSRWQYGDTGYVLLGILVRRASGRFYGDLLRERFFAPLGMAQARVISEADIVPHRAAGYRLQDGELKHQHWVAPSLNTTADGSLQMSLDDLIAWDRGVRERRILSEASWRQMATPVTLNDGTRFPHGFGWALETVGGQTRVQHDGEWQGFRSWYARDLGPDLSVIVLANAAHADAKRIGEVVAGLWHPALAPRPEAAEPAR